MKPPIHPPIGKLVDIGSHTLHIHSSGIGSPTVVLEAGGMGWSLDWHLVQSEVARFTSVCSYDRAGFGWSESGPTPRTSQQIAKELHELLNQTDIETPIILVGASFGGHIVRLYAHTYPKDVAGMILLDARHEDIDLEMPSAWKKMEAAGKSMNQGMLFAAKAGFLKAMGKMMGEKTYPPIYKKLPAELQTVYLEVGFQPKYFQSNLDELATIKESDQEIRKTGGFGDLPLIVVRHGKPEMFANMPPDQAKKAENAWQELQNDLMKLSTNCQMVIAEESGHNIQVDQPNLVVLLVKQMTEKIRGNMNN